MTPKGKARTNQTAPLAKSLALASGADTDLSLSLRVGAIVRSMRKQAGLSQAQLGDRIGVSQARISEIEAGLGRHGPSFVLVERISAACGASVVIEPPLRSGYAESEATLLSPLAIVTEPNKSGELEQRWRLHSVGDPGENRYEEGLVDAAGRIIHRKNGSDVRIRLKASEPTMLESALTRIENTAKTTGCLIRGPIPLPTRIETFVAGPKSGGRSRQKFEVRTYKRLIDIVNPSAKTVDALAKLELASGVDVDISVGAHKALPLDVEFRPQGSIGLGMAAFAMPLMILPMLMGLFPEDDSKAGKSRRKAVS